MDILGFVDLPLWLLLLLLGLFTVYVYGTWPYRTWSKLGVPGPPPIIFLGNMPELFKPGGHIEANKKWMQEYGRIFGVYNFRAPLLYVTELEAVKQILVTDFNKFTDRHFFSDRILVHNELNTALFFATGSTWKRIRSVMSPMMTGAKMRLMSSCIDRCSCHLADRVVSSHGKNVDIKRLAQAFALDTISGTGFSIETDALEDLDNPLIQHARSLFKTGPYIAYFYFLAALLPALTRPMFKILNYGIFRPKDLSYFDNAIEMMIKERCKLGIRNTDFLQLLIDAEVELLDDDIGKHLSKEEIVAQCLMIYIAGFETTSNALQFILYLLAKHPDCQEKLIDEIDNVMNNLNGDFLSYEDCNNMTYLNMVIKESLRLYPPSAILFRLANQETKVQGYSVPAGAGVWIPVHVISRDPDYFHEPDIFNPSRFSETSPLKQNIGSKLLTWLPFGMGPRHCVGMRLAMLELKMAVIRILHISKVVSATPDVLEVIDVTSLLQPTKPILIKFEKRKKL